LILERSHERLEAPPLNFPGVAGRYHFVPCLREGQSLRRGLQKSLDLLDGMLPPIHRSRWFRGLSFFRKIAFIGDEQCPRKPPQAPASSGLSTSLLTNCVAFLFLLWYVTRRGISKREPMEEGKLRSVGFITLV
jgi:hypothetical protein